MLLPQGYLLQPGRRVAFCHHRDRVCLHQNHCARDVPAVLVEHDLTFNLYCRLVQTDPSDAARGEYLRWLDFERHWLAAYDAVWTMSEEERGGAIREGSDPERTLVVPNGVDVRRFVPGEEGELAPAAFPEVFYVGSFRHLPNILGFQRLCREVMPRVWQRVPNARLRVVAGPRHEYFWSTLAKKGESMDSDPRFEIQGYVEDLRPLYARATVVVAPLEVSAGTNIKVLEAMACGDHAGRVRRAGSQRRRRRLHPGGLGAVRGGCV